MSYRHVSCMPNEIITYLGIRKGGTYVDGTLGGSGHARRILEAAGADARLIGIDQDPDALNNAETVLAPFRDQVTLVHDNFANIRTILQNLAIPRVDGILVDIGLSLHQLEGSGRGFSFLRDEPLDMRMNPAAHTTAAELIQTEDEAELTRIFKAFGEEKFARPIARRIMDEREKNPIRTSRQLAELIRDMVPKKVLAKQKIHPATRVFMALRIAVNRELERLETFLNAAPDHLVPGGRIVVLSFHSLEDRIVKRHFRTQADPCTCPPNFPVCHCGRKPSLKVLTRKAVSPTEKEIAANPMSRSTKLRAAEKLPLSGDRPLA